MTANPHPAEPRAFLLCNVPYTSVTNSPFLRRANMPLRLQLERTYPRGTKEYMIGVFVIQDGTRSLGVQSDAGTFACTAKGIRVSMPGFARTFPTTTDVYYYPDSRAEFIRPGKAVPTRIEQAVRNGWARLFRIL